MVTITVPVAEFSRISSNKNSFLLKVLTPRQLCSTVRQIAKNILRLKLIVNIISISPSNHKYVF